MHKSQLIVLLAEETQISQMQAEKIVDLFFGSIEEGLVQGERTELRGFGTFKIKDYEGYLGRNPKTGESIEVPPKRMPFFKVGRDLKAMVANEKRPSKKVRK